MNFLSSPYVSVYFITDKKEKVSFYESTEKCMEIVEQVIVKYQATDTKLFIQVRDVNHLLVQSVFLNYLQETDTKKRKK